MAKRKSEDQNVAESPIDYPQHDPATAPPTHSPSWQDYCMGLFVEGEVVKRDNGSFPNAGGLRRVAELVIGPIVDMQPIDVQGPCEANGWSATAACRVGFASRELGRDVYFSGEADCIPGDEGNLEAAFARFPTAMAGTRARVRALRNALRLNKAAIEELTDLPVVERRPPNRKAGTIKGHQLNGIRNTCNVLGIDPLKFINKNGSSYGDVEEMNAEGAQKALELLNSYHQDRSRIPDAIKI